MNKVNTTECRVIVVYAFSRYNTLFLLDKEKTFNQPQLIERLFLFVLLKITLVKKVSQTRAQ
ncbi:hypothetical protein EEX84_14930 [Planococcus salinus]|uniref:Uncharacterized protein n=1 Tax=Planococcus salinus TaxID=1848460 RepID=A0A3M8P433_9BACL|nr:hypothetical protein EEX84_14930 [Planococcus salinus]